MNKYNDCGEGCGHNEIDQEALKECVLEANKEQLEVVEKYRKDKEESNYVDARTPEEIENEPETIMTTASAPPQEELDETIYNCGDFGCDKHPPTPQDWEERLQVEVMEDYLQEAKCRVACDEDYKEHLENMRGHFDKLKQFISTLLAEQDRKAWALATKSAKELWIPEALAEQREEMVKDCHKHQDELEERYKAIKKINDNE